MLYSRGSIYLGNALLRCVLFFNLEVSFNFHLTFLQLNVLNMFTKQWKPFFPLLPAIFFELPITQTPDNSNLFSISLEGPSYRESTVWGNPPRGGGGGYSTNFYPGRLLPKVQPHTLLYTIFHEKRNPFCLPYKWYPFHFPWLELCIPFNCCKWCTVA